MDATAKKRPWSWPLAFFILNLLAILAWFAVGTGFGVHDLVVVGVTPGGDDVDPANVSEIRVNYNLPLHPDSVKPDSLRFIPPLAGKTEPAGSVALRFLPREPLRPATTYTVVPSPNLRGSGGERPRADLVEFSTARLRLESAVQAGYDRDSFTIELSFNQPVAADDLRKAAVAAFSLPERGSGAPERVEVLGHAASRQQRLRIREPRSCYLRLTLPAGLAGAGGPLGLAKDEELVFRIVGAVSADRHDLPEWAANREAIDLKPEVAFLGMTAEWEDGGGVIRVRTTSPLNAATARDHVRVSPEVPLTFSPAWNGLKIRGDFQPGKQYRVTLAKGLPAENAGELTEEIGRSVWFDDLPTHLAFSHGGGFLSPAGLLTIPVKTRNLGAFRLELRRLYASNIVEAILKEYNPSVDKEYAEPEISRRFVTGGARNRDQETLLDLRDIVGAQPLGVYGLEIFREDRRWDSREAMVAVSDLGLGVRAGRDKILAWGTSIREGTPREGARIGVYSNKRQLLCEGTTGADGVAVLDLPALPADERPVLVLGEGEPGEFSFVRLDRDNRSRGAAARQGDAYARGYEVFLTAERGVYRGGETVLVSGLARDENMANAPELPLELRLIGPDAKTLKTAAVRADVLGRIHHELALGEAYAGGVYTVEARLPGQNDALGTTLFRIADYLPETLAIALELEDETSRRDGTDGESETGGDWENSLLIKVARLAGGELGPLPVKVTASYAAVPFTPKGWEDWTFGDTRLAGGVADSRSRDVTLGADGRAAAGWDNPALAFPAAAAMTVRVEASETGGRAASETLRTIIHPVPFYAGVLPPEASPETGVDNTFHLAAVAPDGELYKPADTPWTGRLARVEYTGVMKKLSDGRVGYEWVRQEITESELSGVWREGASLANVNPRAGGQYRLTVDVADGRGCVYEFAVRGPGAAWHGEDPETLTIELDKKDYRVGDEAVASVPSPFAGKALISVETDEVLAHWIEDFAKGDNSFRVPVSDAMRPNAQIGVTLLRPAKAEAEWQPHRLSGTAVLAVDNADRRLKVELDAPETFAPGKPARVAVKVGRDGEPAADAPVVLWAVDVGVLSLTGYKTPSPWNLFYRARRAGVVEADMFSRLAPELTAWLDKEAAPGGSDAAGGELARRLNPIFASRVKAAVLFNATLRTDADGVAATELAIPEFAGRLRLMCWAADADRMGADEKEIEVKAPVSVAAAWPRFAAPGDVFQVPVTVINRSGAAGTVIVTAEAGDNLAIEPKRLEVALDDNGSRVVSFQATAGEEAGLVRASVTAGLAGETFTDRVEFALRPPLLFSRDAGVVTLEPGEERSFILAPGMMEKNSRVKLVAGGHPLIDLAGCLDSLLDYPYGCAEQTASRLLALIYLPDLLALSRPGQLESGEIAVLATACIERLSTMQSANGALKTWPKGGEELFWVSSQALYSLLESRGAGHPVPDGLVDNLARYLDSRIDGQLADEALDTDGGEAVAMACLALAKADRLKRSWLLRLEEIADARARLDRPLASAALAFLCEAVAVAGDADAALALYNRFKPSGVEPGAAGNRIVDGGAWLLASMAVGADADEQAEYANDIADRIKDGFTHWSTKENSLILTALGRYWQKVGPLPEATAFLARNGVKTKFSTRRGASWDKMSAGVRVDVKSPAEGSLRLFWLAEGIPLTGKAREEDLGLVARRRLFDSAGRQVTEPFALNRGEVYEVRLRVTGTADDLVLVDLLPAGLEIEDATMKGRSLSGDAAKGLLVKNVEIRDDRLLVFASLKGSGEYRYLARAVTGGRFAWPALDASRMYDATTRSVHGAGEMTVTDKAANDG